MFYNVISYINSTFIFIGLLLLIYGCDNNKPSSQNKNPFLLNNQSNSVNINNNSIDNNHQIDLKEPDIINEGDTLETILSFSEIMAGSSIDVYCFLVNQNGIKRQIIATILSDSEQGIEIIDDSVKGLKADTYNIYCSLPQFQLEDTSPEQLTVIPNNVTIVETIVTNNNLEIGITTFISCEASDNYGNNVVIDLPDFEVICISGNCENNDNFHERFSINNIKFLETGFFNVSCMLNSIKDLTPEEVEVTQGNIVSVETELSFNNVTAGTEILVSCSTHNESGYVSTNGPFQISISPQNDIIIENNRFTTIKSGNYTIACTYNELSDSSPEHLIVTPFEPYKLNTVLNHSEIKAGETVAISCLFFDKYNNEIVNELITSDSEVEILPSGEHQNMEFIPETTGSYTIKCKSNIQSISEILPSLLIVTPGAARSAQIELNPIGPFFKPGDETEISVIVKDRYGNLIEHPEINLSSNPIAGIAFVPDSNTILLNLEGYYTIFAEVTADIQSDLTELIAEKQIFIDGGAPIITVTSPDRASTFIKNDEEEIIVKGSVTEQGVGILNFTINNESVEVSPLDSTFSYTMSPKYGLNIVDIIAEDAAGNISVENRAFLWAEKLILPDPQNFKNSAIDNGFLFRMGKNSLDDNDTENINDLATIVRLIVNNFNITESIENPILDNPCIVDINDFTWNKNQTNIQISPEIDGLRITVNLKIVKIFSTIKDTDPMDADSLCNAGSGYIQIGDAVVNMLIGFENSEGILQLKLLDNNVLLGGLNFYFDSPLTGILNMLSTTITPIIEQYLEQTVRDELEPQLENLFKSLVIESEMTLTEPKEINLNLYADFSSITSSHKNIVIGLKPILYPNNISSEINNTGSIAHITNITPEFDENSSMSTAISYDFLNSALYNTWLTGIFNIDILEEFLDEDTLGNLDLSEVSVQLSATLPPVIVSNDSIDYPVKISLGEVTLAALVTMENVPEVTADFYISMIAEAKIKTDNSTLKIVFNDKPKIYIDYTSENLPIPNMDEFLLAIREELGEMLLPLLSDLISEIELPTFETESISQDFSLPVMKMGITSAVNTFNEYYLLLEGDFGEIN